jgi:hypothetical protein
MPTSRNGNSLPSCRHDNLDLLGVINSITAASCSVYLTTRSVIISVIIVVAAALLVIANLRRER